MADKPARWWGWSRGWEDWYRRLLPAYALFLAAGTHFPAPNLRGGPSDKRIHFFVFAVLAFAFWKFFESFIRPLSPRLVWWALLALSIYTALDEWTQQFVGRDSDIMDWFADMTGVVTALGVLEALRRLQNQPAIGKISPP